MEDSPVLSCIKLLKNQEKKQSKAEPPSRQSQDNELSAEFTWNSLDRTYRPGWSNPTEYPPPWHHSYHTCQRIIPEHRVYGYDFTLPRSKDWDQAECCAQDPALPRAPRSATDVDLWDSKVRALICLGMSFTSTNLFTWWFSNWGLGASIPQARREINLHERCC